MKKKLISLEVSCDEMCDLMMLKQELKLGVPARFTEADGKSFVAIEKNRDSERQLEIVSKLIESAKEL